MVPELIATVIGAAALAGGLIHLLHKHYCRKNAARRLIQRYIQDCFADEADYMETYRALSRKACMENAQKNFHKKKLTSRQKNMI